MANSNKVRADELAEIKNNTNIALNNYLNELNTNKAFKIEYYSALIEKCYRNLAVLEYLTGGDRHNYFIYMYLASGIRVRYLLCIDYDKMEHKKDYLYATRESSLYEGLASGNEEFSITIAGLKFNILRHPTFDTDEGYLRSMLFRACVLAVFKKDATLIDDELLIEYEKVVDEKSEGFLLFYTAVRAGKNDAFNQAILKILEARRTELEEDEHDEKVEFGERWLYVEGLALVRVGNLLGLECKVKDSLIPEELQSPPENIVYPVPKNIWPKRPTVFS